MRFFAPVTVLILDTASLPAFNARDEPVNVLAPIREEFTSATCVEGAETFVVEATEKRSAVIEKRAKYMHVNVWRDANKKDRHKSLYLERKPQHWGPVQSCIKY
jgi:hypothetical protein